MIKVRNLGKRQFVKIIRKLERAVKDKCYECSSGHKRVICEMDDCSLYPFRPWAEKVHKNDSTKDNGL